MPTQIYTRTEEEFRQAAEFQFRALKASADLFDLGEIGEASRMANAIFVLAGEGLRRHVGILDAVDQKKGRLYRSTKPVENALGCALVYLKLVKVEVNQWEYSLSHAGRSSLENGRDLLFNEWWSEPVIFNDTVNLSRAEIIRLLRDKNGGAHFDPLIEDSQAIDALRGEVGLFNIASENGTVEVIPFGLEFAMRQIATEFWYSFAEDKTFGESKECRESTN